MGFPAFTVENHINLCYTMRHPKVSVRNEPAVIVGMYPNFFQIEERESGYPRRHTLQYNDVLMGRVEILELQDV